MSDYFDEYDRKIFEAMKNKDWWIDKFKARKIELIKSCRRINSNSSISRKIGGLLLWQQVIEQFLKEINQISLTYVKAEIWPTKIDFKIDYDRKTFGQVIEIYKNYSVDYEDRPKILGHLKTINDNRRTITHRMFEVENLEDLEDIFESSYNIHEELLKLLLDHYILIGNNLEDLKKRVDWEDFLDELNNKNDT